LRGALFSLLSLVLIIAFYNIYNSYKNENCVRWEQNHYVKINCDNEQAIPNPIDINIEKFSKVNVSDSTIFFMNNKPVIWYGKSNKGELEFFNSRGIHPATGKELKPITAYIVNKYVYKKDQ